MTRVKTMNKVQKDVLDICDQAPLGFVTEALERACRHVESERRTLAGNNDRMAVAARGAFHMIEEISQTGEPNFDRRRLNYILRTKLGVVFKDIRYASVFKNKLTDELLKQL